jgi:hypothetical protein
MAFTPTPVIRAIVVDDGNTAHTQALITALAQQTLQLEAIAVITTQPQSLALMPKK